MTYQKPKEEQDCIDKGYKALGWQVHTGNCEDLKKCHELGHKAQEKSHSIRGTNYTFWCDECKIYWKIDMGD